MIITKKKILIYKAFGGDIDGWARSDKSKDKSGITDDDWSCIEELLQGLYSIAKIPVAESYKNNIETKLNTVTNNEETRNLLRTMALDL